MDKPEGICFFLVIDKATSFRARYVDGNDSGAIFSLTYFIQLFNTWKELQREIKDHQVVSETTQTHSTYTSWVFRGTNPSKYFNSWPYHLEFQNLEVVDKWWRQKHFNVHVSISSTWPLISGRGFAHTLLKHALMSYIYIHSRLTSWADVFCLTNAHPQL